MLSELLRRVMAECDLRQKDLAVVLDVPLQRVKHLTAGNVQKLTPDETRRLVQTLNLSAHWLATAEGPMFNSAGGKQLGAALTKIRVASHKTSDLDLTSDEAQAVAAITMGVDLQDLETIRAGLDKAWQSRLSESELRLILSFRQCSADAQAHLLEAATLLSAKA